MSSRRAAARPAWALAVLLASALPCRGLTRGPYIVAASSVSAQVCWMESGKEGCETLSGLIPGATFSYSLPGSTESWVARALPGPSQALRFAIFGDSGKASKAQRRVAALLRRSDPELVIHVGDIVYPRGEAKLYDERYFQIYARELSREPFFTALGNHDYGDYSDAEKGERRFEEVYRALHHKPKYYSFDAGPAHFIALDTNEAYGIRAAAPIGPGSEQRRWLEEDLARTKARWKFVFLHVPLYTSTAFHGDNDYLRRCLEPLFQKYGVDAVFQGHDHMYERSRAIGGVVYITAGTGGAGLTPHLDKSGVDWMEKNLSSYGFASARLEGASLELQFINDQGTVLDSLRIDKGAQAPEEVRFKAEDGWTIAGLYRPPGRGKPVAVLIHGVASGKGEWDRFEAELWKLGLGTLAIDLRGHGDSTEGPKGLSDYLKFDQTGEWPRAEKDLAAAIKFLLGRKIPASRVGLIGASIGANLASRVAARKKALAWVILLSPGRDYRGVELGPVSGGKALVGASPADVYAYGTAAEISQQKGGPAFLEARRGHGVQMFDDPEFLSKLLSWLKEKSGG